MAQSHHSGQNIRQVAESLLQSNQYVQSPVVDNNISHSQSVNTIRSVHDYIISEDLLAGQRYGGGMSNVRRCFCLFVTFDLLFTGLMWLICVMLNGENITEAFSKQIYHYNVHTSLFDIVLAAICRFVVLLLFYALIYINHWIVICISTTLTCSFLVGKVFVYDWPHSTQPVFEVLLVLTSFVLSWVEAWFLDTRVLAQEQYARRYLITNAHSERAPLIQNYVNTLPSMYTESVGNFYSLRGSPEGSVYGVNSGPITGRFPPVRFTSEQEINYTTLAAQTLQEAWDLLRKTDWKLEKQQDIDSVHSVELPKVGKVFKLTAYIEVPPYFLVEELFFNVEKIPNWNSALLESAKIQIIDEYTDISYQVSADGAGGLITSRDFVTLRHWKCIEGCYLIACVGTEHPSAPPNSKYVRGENGVGCYAMHVDPNDPTKCYFQWVLNTNLNFSGWIPQLVKDKAFIGMMFDYAKSIRNHILKLKESSRFNQNYY